MCATAPPTGPAWSRASANASPLLAGPSAPSQGPGPSAQVGAGGTFSRMENVKVSPSGSEAVRVIASGASMVSPTATRRLVERFVAPDPSPEQDRALESLTVREQDVLRLLAGGHTNKEIADELYVGMETVKSHVGSVLLKLGVHNRTQAVITAYETGFVRPRAL